MMKTLANSCQYNTDEERNEDKDSIGMKNLNSQCGEASGISTSDLPSLENSFHGLNIQHDSLLNSHDSVSSSLPSVCTSEASYTSQDSGIGGSVPDDLQKTLKRQGLTVEGLLQSAPPFAVEWKSVRDVFQCLSCAAPIDFLSRKVRCNDMIVKSIHYSSVVSDLSRYGVRVVPAKTANVRRACSSRQN